MLEWSEVVYTAVYSTHNVRGIVCMELGILEAKLAEVCHTEFEQCVEVVQASYRTFCVASCELMRLKTGVITHCGVS